MPPPIASKHQLTAFEEAFVREMIRGDCEPPEAARRAGYLPTVATWAASQLAQRVDVQDMIRTGRAQVHQVIAQETGVRLADLVRLLGQMATFDIADLYDTDGNLKPLDEIPAHARIAIESIDSEEVYEGRGRDRTQVATVKKVRMAKRNEAIDKLMRHLGGYELDHRQQLEPLTQLLGELAKRGRNTLAISNDG